ncbi:MAG: hypothetical protein DI582_05025 [Azospirillum brasilense]|nr:MAG: hypothetical protein DI582_05025 [Azospirillum brasilense]
MSCSGFFFTLLMRTSCQLAAAPYFPILSSVLAFARRGAFILRQKLPRTGIGCGVSPCCVIVFFMIDKVGYSKPVGTARPTRRTGQVGATGFADALSAAEAAAGVDAAGGVEATTSIAAVGGIGALLGAQEVSEHEVRKRKAVRQGRVTLEALEQLRDALLIGTLPLSTLTRLETLVAEERGRTNDPVLQQILDEIELRAAVELAKLEVAGLLPRIAP